MPGLTVVQRSVRSLGSSSNTAAWKTSPSDNQGIWPLFWRQP